MRFDLLIASAGAGLLVWSGRLLVPAARLRPEDIIAYRSLGGGTSYSVGTDPSGGIATYGHFPEDETLLAVRDVVDSKIGFDLLVFGTIAGVAAVIVGAFVPSSQIPSSLDVLWAVVTFMLAIAAGWWATAHSGWRGKQELRLLVHCFIAWLEREVADPKTKGYEFGLAVVNTIRHSGFTLMNEPLRGKGADERAVSQWVIDLARKHRYAWRRDDFRAWASRPVGSG
jgi:hypothetical protein